MRLWVAALNLKTNHQSTGLPTVNRGLNGVAADARWYSEKMEIRTKRNRREAGFGGMGVALFEFLAPALSQPGWPGKELRAVEEGGVTVRGVVGRGRTQPWRHSMS